MLLGLSGIGLSRRFLVPLGVVMLGSLGLWLWSIPYTAGGLFYSMRVLTPAWVTLAIGAGAWGPLVSRWQAARPVLVRSAVLLPIMLCGGYAVLASWSHPKDAREFRTAIVSRRPFPEGVLEWPLRTEQVLNDSGLPDGGLLTDDCYLAVALGRDARFRPVMAWSPEAAFVFEPNQNILTVHRRLQEKNIFYASFMPMHEAFWSHYPYFFVSLDGGNIVRGTTTPLRPVLILPEKSQ